MKVAGHVLMLNHDAQLCEHHIDASGGFDFDKVVGQVVRNPSDPNVWGLRNMSGQRWSSALPDGRVVDVDPGRSVTLAPGVRVQFGKTEGEIRSS